VKQSSKDAALLKIAAQRPVKHIERQEVNERQEFDASTAFSSSGGTGRFIAFFVTRVGELRVSWRSARLRARVISPKPQAATAMFLTEFGLSFSSDQEQ